MPIYRKDRDDSYDDDDDSGRDSKDGTPKDNDEDAASALLPKSVLGDHKLKPGDQVMLEVVHIYEDEVEVKYGRKDKEKKEKRDQDSDNDKMDEESAGTQMGMSQQQLSGLMAGKLEG